MYLLDITSLKKMSFQLVMVHCRTHCALHLHKAVKLSYSSDGHDAHFPRPHKSVSRSPATRPFVTIL